MPEMEKRGGMDWSSKRERFSTRPYVLEVLSPPNSASPDSKTCVHELLRDI